MTPILTPILSPSTSFEFWGCHQIPHRISLRFPVLRSSWVIQIIDVLSFRPWMPPTIRWELYIYAITTRSYLLPQPQPQPTIDQFPITWNNIRARNPQLHSAWEELSWYVVNTKLVDSKNWSHARLITRCSSLLLSDMIIIRSNFLVNVSHIEGFSAVRVGLGWLLRAGLLAGERRLPVLTET